jgi:hypothetical protein
VLGEHDLAGSIPVTPIWEATMGKKKKRPMLDVRVFENMANRLREVRSAMSGYLDLLADALDAAAMHIRDDREQDERLGRSKEKEQQEHDCVCIFCKDTGVSESGWSEGDPCHCPMGVAREEAEKVGLASADKRIAQQEEKWN